MKIKPTLYLFIRNDVDSMNAGKAVAQGSHATNDFEIKIRKHAEKSMEWANALDTWRGDGPAGRALVFGARGDQFELLKNIIENNYSHLQEELVWGSYTDPTYPIRDKDITHVVPFNSAMWIFCKNSFEINHIPSWFVNSTGQALISVDAEIRKLSLY